MSSPQSHEANSRSHKRKPSKQASNSNQHSVPQKPVGKSSNGRDSPSSSAKANSSSLITQMPILISGLAVLLACVYSAVKATTHGTDVMVVASTANASGQIQAIDRLDFNVFGQDGPFRQSSITEFFNPSNTTPPFFQVFDPRFLQILGPNPSIRIVASNPEFAFAHEAPIWLQETDEVTFASNDGGALGMSDLDHNNQVAKISLKEVQEKIKAAGGGVKPVNVTVTKQLDLPETVQMTNGGTGPLNGSLLLINSGRGPLPPSIVLSDPNPPFTTTVLLDNFFGRQFNSLNDIKIHPTTKKLFFTDAPYGFANQFRPPTLMPNQVYRFDPDTGSVRVVADGFNKSNGVAFSQDGKTAYVYVFFRFSPHIQGLTFKPLWYSRTDTGVNFGVFGLDQTAPATIYAFDVHPTSQAFMNRRVFAYADTGLPDGIQLDTKGNVYSGCGDGVQVWDSDGTLLGKFFIGTTSANMVFAGQGRLVILGETAVYLAEIAASGFNLAH
ncbi:hypothetical protein EIP91_011211 [Steccherinum ochraceum]|uniref:SMP-30/Gluconolactonase/LRE-like region domain-containing protein n=1 Tax=Steccherinum ochraceum TaxID=92696 RepID=A0A4R0R210_9APHY|nr:hypothetical protein EIP91_011211 [Steccherinum ochraceum]